MALTAEQLSDLQADLGIDDSQAVFTDAALERLYTRAGEEYTTAVYMAWRQLLAAATAYIDYKVAQTSVSRSQVYSHIEAMVAHWQTESENATNSQGVRIVGMNQIPPRYKEEPFTADGERRQRLRRAGYP